MDNLKQNSSSFGPLSRGSAANHLYPAFPSASHEQLPRTELCTKCSNLISLEYYRFNGKMLCGVCAVRARIGLSSDSPTAFAGAMLFGLGAAILGCFFYSGFAIATHMSVGYLAVVVGWMVGRAIMQGSNGLGGGRYQMLAVLLTYAAISLAAIPTAVYEVYSQTGAIPDLGAFLSRLLVLGLASPFLGWAANPISYGLGVVILCIGLRIAWQITRAKPVNIAGPYFLVEQ